MNITLIMTVFALVFSIVLLWRGADLFIDSAVVLARRWRIPEMVVGIVLVGFGTSTPELVVSVGAAIKGQSDISVANVVGSNIFNFGFILGGCALIATMPIAKVLFYRDGLILLAITILLDFFIQNQTLTRLHGLVFLACFAAYLAFLFLKRENVKKSELAPSVEEIIQEEFRPLWRELLFTFLGLGLILIGSEILVWSASSIARSFGLSEWLIGVTIVAAGTSAPELVSSLNASLKGKHDISVGNLVGSNLYNIMFILGVSAVVHPLKVNPAALISTHFCVGMVLLVVLFMRTRWKISRLEGAFLVAANILNWWMEIVTPFKR